MYRLIFALLEHVKKLQMILMIKNIQLGVFIDLNKDFDTIDLQLLLKKLEFYVSRGLALTWLTSYLSNRKQ